MRRLSQGFYQHLHGGDQNIECLRENGDDWVSSIPLKKDALGYEGELGRFECECDYDIIKNSFNIIDQLLSLPPRTHPLSWRPVVAGWPGWSTTIGVNWCIFIYLFIILFPVETKN